MVLPALNDAITNTTSGREADNRLQILNSRELLVLIAVVLLGRIVLSAYLPLTDFSEARYAEISRQILVTGDWVTLWFNPEQPFWGKPPLVFWSTAVSFMLFGISETTARLPPLLFILATAWLLYTWLSVVGDRPRARLGAFAFLSSWLALQLAGSVVLDAALTFCITLVLTQFWFAVTQAYPGEAPPTRPGAVWLMWIGLGLGLLVKGPIIPVLCGLTAVTWIVWQRRLNVIRHLRPVAGPLLMLAIALPWYWLAEARSPGFIDYFLIGEHFNRYVVEAWQGDLYGGVKDQPLGMIWGYLLIGAFPLSLLVPLLAFRMFRGSPTDSTGRSGPLGSFLVAWTLTAPLFFTFSENILVTYVAPSVPPLAAIFSLYVAPEWFRRSALLFTMTSVTYFAAFVYVWETDYQGHRYNQKPIIDHYRERSESDPGPLIYTGASRFSVEFYTGGEVAFTSRPPAYYTDETFYLAVRDMWQRGEVLSGRCQSLKHHGEFTLWYCPGASGDVDS